MLKDSPIIPGVEEVAEVLLHKCASSWLGLIPLAANTGTKTGTVNTLLWPAKGSRLPLAAVRPKTMCFILI